MKKGVLLFAFNNSTVNYVKQAIWSAQRIKRHLGIGTTLITDASSKPDVNEWFDDVIVIDSGSGGVRQFDHMDQNTADEWKNLGRCLAYELTPYKQTIILDTDFVVASDRLNILFESNQDFICHRYISDITKRDNFAADTRFGTINFPMWWATVTYFVKSDYSQRVFHMWQMIEKNWRHYARLYKFPLHIYRNDFALSIALNTVNGHVQENIPSIPWPLHTTFYDVYLNQLEEDSFQLNYVRFGKKEQHQRLKIKNMDFHVMNKPDLDKLCDA